MGEEEDDDVSDREGGDDDTQLTQSSSSSSSKPESDDVPQPSPADPAKPYTAAEYSKAVDQWLWQCYYWQNVAAGFPHFLAAAAAAVAGAQQNYTTGGGLLAAVAVTPNGAAAAAAPYLQGQHHHTSARAGEREYLIPPLWKRFAAEFIDFFILFLLKLVVTFVAIDFFEIIDLDKYDFNIIKEELLDFKLAFEMTSEIILLEIIHRFVVCFFEALCLHRGTVSQGGATPGKSMLGLKVVSCTRVEDLRNGCVIVRPANDIGFGWALLRSFIKNFSLAFFFPVCFTMLVFQHNRSVYDLLCRCIVVEDRHTPRPHLN